jgi:hypothetical protein
MNQHYECSIRDGLPLSKAIQQTLLNMRPTRVPQVPLPPLPNKPPASQPDGQIDVIATYNERHLLERLMLDHGYLQPTIDYGKWMYPESTSGIAGVVVKDGKMYSHHESDPLHGKWLSPFNFMMAVNGFTLNEAVTYAAKNTKVDPNTPESITVDQNNKALRQNKLVVAAFSEIGNGIKVTEVDSPKTALMKLQDLSATNRIGQMEENLSNDVFIFTDMALDGQITLFYAKPNSGKTLFFFRFLIDGIDDGRIKASDVIYLNADDNYKGTLTKAKIAQQYGFLMISPAEAGISPDDVLALLKELADGDDAKGKIIIIDTLKKFTDLMNKTVQRGFYELLRRLVAKNATVIIAGHANKKPDEDGNLIYEGTADTMNDVDCAYAMYVTDQTDDETIVEFRQEKSRGDVIQKVSYGYIKRSGASYRDLVDSVYKLDDKSAAKMIAKNTKQKTLQKYDFEIRFLDDVLSGKSLNQTQIMNAFDELKNSEVSVIFSRNALKAALTALDGLYLDVRQDYANFNAKIYSISPSHVALLPLLASKFNGTEEA